MSDSCMSVLRIFVIFLWYPVNKDIKNNNEHSEFKLDYMQWIWSDGVYKRKFTNLQSWIYIL